MRDWKLSLLREMYAAQYLESDYLTGIASCCGVDIRSLDNPSVHKLSGKQNKFCISRWKDKEPPVGREGGDIHSFLIPDDSVNVLVEWREW